MGVPDELPVLPAAKPASPMGPRFLVDRLGETHTSPRGLL